jgi:hypothetical protein
MAGFASLHFDRADGPSHRCLCLHCVQLSNIQHRFVCLKHLHLCSSIFAFASIPPSTASAACTRLRCLWRCFTSLRPCGLQVPLHSISISTALFRIVALSSFWVTISSFALDTLGCASSIPLHSASPVSFRCASLRFDLVGISCYSTLPYSSHLVFDLFAVASFTS